MYTLADVERLSWSVTAWLASTTAWLALATVLLGVALALLLRSRRRATTVAFFHPYCNSGGGGERVLWCAVRWVQATRRDARIVVYTGDTEPLGTVLDKARSRFGVVVDARNVRLVRLRTRVLLEASCYPVLTMLGQSLGSMVVGAEALAECTPAVFVDTMGYAFTYPLFAWLGGARVVAYVHYPTISTDMLDVVAAGAAAHNNAAALARSPTLRRAKLAYYRAFAIAYGCVGRRADVVMVNSTWTKEHINALWRVAERTAVVYPPCDTRRLQTIDVPATRRRKQALSIAQFRPEKNHSLQLRVWAHMQRVQRRHRDARLVLAGSVRNDDDRARLDRLRNEARALGIERTVDFCVNVSYAELLRLLSESLVGVHTMWNEHFGISVVELMAAGVVTVAHDSGGPRADIVASTWGESQCGFLASTCEAYADKIACIFDEQHGELAARVQQNGRASVATRFSEHAFDEALRANLDELLRTTLA